MGKDLSMEPREYCPIKKTIRLIGKQWTLLILHELNKSPRKTLGFMDLSRKLEGSSSKVLSERLKELSADGLIGRDVVEGSKPQRVNYSLTQKGNEACEIMEHFKSFGVKYSEEDFECEDLSCELCPHNHD
jgi:DNA-binding HxlR family transcriptional regulator